MSKHILVCENDLYFHTHIANHFMNLFGRRGDIHISIVDGAYTALPILKNCKIDLILLDRNMTYGNGEELLSLMDNEQITNIPVITFSRLEEHNKLLYDAGADWKSSKEEVFSGERDYLIKTILDVK